MWLVGPYLPGGRAADDRRINVVRNMWREALRRAARPFDELAGVIGPARLARLGPRSSVERLPPWAWNPEIVGLDDLVVDVRMCRPGKGLAEVIKYLFKDTVGGGREKVDPQEYATVYEAFDGARTTQGSRGLMCLADRERMLTGYVLDREGAELREVTVSDLRELRVGCACGHCGETGHYVEGVWCSVWRRRRRPLTPEERAALDARRPLAKTKARQVPFFAEVKIS